MPSREEKSRIDAQWQALQPGWGKGDYKGERQMLYDDLKEGEAIKHLWSGGWKVLERGEAMEGHDRGIVVATNRRVLFLNKGRISKSVARIPYWNILTVKEADPGVVGITSLDYNYETRLPAGEAASFVNFVQSRLPADEASVKEQFSHILDTGESIEYWIRCFVGEETVVKGGEFDDRGKVKEEWLEADGVLRAPRIAVVTDRRVLFASDGGLHSNVPYALNVPYANFLTVKWLGKRMKFVALGSDEVYVIQPSEGVEARKLTDTILGRLTVPGRLDQKRPRILAEWRMQQPIWSHTKKHDKERNKLPEIMDDGERLEGLLSGFYRSNDENGHSREGVIVATDRRLIFVSESIIGGKNVGQLPYGCIVEVAYEKGRVHEEINIISTPGYPDYSISSMDDQRPHNTRQSGYAGEFAALVRGYLPHSIAPASNRPVISDDSKHARINIQWQERSPGWKLDTRKNEREKLYEVLYGHEDIERLIQGRYKLDQNGAESYDVVVAATDRRLIFVYNGWAGAHLNWMGYHQIESVEGESKLMGEKVTVVAQGGLASYVVEINHDDYGKGMDRFVECARSHLGP